MNDNIKDEDQGAIELGGIDDSVGFLAPLPFADESVHETFDVSTFESLASIRGNKVGQNKPRSSNTLPVDRSNQHKRRKRPSDTGLGGVGFDTQLETTNSVQKEQNSSNLRSKKSRQVYSEEDRRLILEADRIGGRRFRLERAEELGMPKSTADNLVSKHRKSVRRYSATDEKRLANGKLQQWHCHFLTTLLYFNASIKLSAIREAVNFESLRRLGGNPQQLMQEIAPTVPVLDPVVHKMYETAEIKGDETIRRWIESIPISRKHVPAPYEQRNAPHLRQLRLNFATWIWNCLMQGSLDDFIMIDGMSFHLGIHKQDEWSSPGIRPEASGPTNASPHEAAAAALIKSQQNASLQSQIGIASSPSYGMVYANTYNPESQIRLSPEGKRGGSSYSYTWDEEQFMSFVNDIFKVLSERSILYQGKQVHLVFTSFPVPRDDEEMFHLFRELGNYTSACASLQAVGASLRFIKVPDYSACLNFSEFFCRALREQVCELRNCETFDMYPLRTYKDGKPEVRNLNILDKAIHNSLCKLKDQPWHLLLAEYRNEVEHLVRTQGET